MGSCGRGRGAGRRVFNVLTTSYLFLGGTGAGALAVLCVLECARVLRWRALAMPEEFFARAWPMCTVTLATGMLCLLVDLGRHDRLLGLFASPAPSVMAAGSFALVAASASCGIATAFLAASFVETRHPHRGPLVWLARIDGGIVVVEAGCLAAFVLLAFAGEETAAAARALAFGELAPVFWGVLAVCGLAVPLVLERFLTHGNSRTQLLWIAALLLVGGFALRWCIVGAGAYDVTQMPEALYGLSTFGLTG